MARQTHEEVLSKNRSYYHRRGKYKNREWVKANPERVREMKRESDKRCYAKRVESRRKYLQSEKGKQWEGDWYAKRMTVPFIRIRKLLSGAMRRAQKSGIEFEKELNEILPSMSHVVCPCCNLDFDYSTSRRGVKNSKTRTHRSPSLDRVDSTKGYTVQNTRVICWGCNSLKSNGTIADFVNILAYMQRETRCSASNAEPPSIDSFTKAVNGEDKIAVVQ